jgi:hypothetical protein
MKGGNCWPFCYRVTDLKSSGSSPGSKASKKASKVLDVDYIESLSSPKQLTIAAKNEKKFLKEIAIARKDIEAFARKEAIVFDEEHYKKFGKELTVKEFNEIYARIFNTLYEDAYNELRKNIFS